MKKRKRTDLRLAVDFLNGEICMEKVYHYKFCMGQMVIYCSMECYEVLVLSKQSTMLHEKNTGFEEKEEEKDDAMEIGKT